MKKYLYLTHRDWVPPWISGGTVPLKLASSYRRKERSGIFTPDEARIDKSSMDLDKLAPAVIFDGNNRDCYLGKVVSNGVVLGQDIVIDRYEEDGLILCLCNRRSKKIATRLEKEACVRILDIEKLATTISKQVGADAVHGNCQYTNGHERNHFLKSEADSWQDEYRLFWPYQSDATVLLPSGIATRIQL